MATAAHDVLVHYYPGPGPQLAADLAASLAGIDPAARSKGARIGAKAAAGPAREPGGRPLPRPVVPLLKAPGPGVWQPNPGTTDMLAPWLGSLRPLVLTGRCA